MKRTFIVGFLVIALAAGTVLAQAPPAFKLGVFDAGRLTEETDVGRQVQKTLSDLRDKKQAQLAAKQKEIENLQGQLSTQGLSLSPEKRGAIEKDIQKKGLELNQAREAAQSDMQMEIGEAQSKFQQQLLSVIESFGKEEGFSLILERGLVAYANPGVDVTTALVDRFNKMIPAAAEKPAAADKPAASPKPEKK